MALLALAVIGGNDGGAARILDDGGRGEGDGEETGPVAAVRVVADARYARASEAALVPFPGGLDAIFPAPLVAPTPVQDLSALPSIEEQFFAGWHDAGGVKEDEALWRMIQCESGWRINPPGKHLGLAQFAPGTWWTVAAITGYTDWIDPYHQGRNAATWANLVSPGTTAGWPTCWFR